MARTVPERRTFGAIAIVGIFLTSGVASPGAAQDARIEQMFLKFDIDGSGRITRDKFEQKKAEIIFSGSSDRGATLKYEDTRISRGAFDAIDLDHNGVLSAGEVMYAPLFKFDGWDVDQDGYISREEFTEQLRRIER